MSKHHCRYCGDFSTDHGTGAGFASLEAYDAHLLWQPLRDDQSPTAPHCVGQLEGIAWVDPSLARQSRRMAALTQKSISARSSLLTA